MAWRGLLILTTLLLALAAAPPALAATAIAHSQADNTYGWCAGYSYGRARSCALETCGESGGKQCEVVVECPGGWGAVAFSETPAQGFAGACGADSAQYARRVVIEACIVASNALCWTDSTFNQNGRDRPEQEDLDFDVTWYTQALLQRAKYDPGLIDGEMGPKTRDAIRHFQARLNLAADGLADPALVRRLLDATMGTQSFIDQVAEQLLPDDEAEFGNLLYSTAAPANPKTSFGAELMGRSEADRLAGLASMLMQREWPCTPSATAATPIPDAESGVWQIVCPQDTYTLVMSDSSTLITTGDVEIGDDTGDDSSNEDAAPSRHGKLDN